VTNVSVDLDGRGEQPGTAAAMLLGIEDEFSMSIWFKPESLKGRRTLVDLFDPVDRDRSRIQPQIHERNGTPIGFQTKATNGSVLQRLEVPGRLSVGRWTHVLVTHMWGSRAQIYVDGVKRKPSRVYLDRSSGSMSGTARELAIGSNDTRLQDFLEGKVGHVAMWSRRLSKASASSIHEAGHERDLREAYGDTADALEHYWRLGEDLDWIGAAWVSDAPVHLDQTLEIDDSDVVFDAP